MNIASVQYTIQNKALEIYLAGCSGEPKCTNCHNPELWDFNLGEPYNDDYIHKIVSKFVEFETLIQNFMIFGGEPLDQNHEELHDLLFDLRLMIMLSRNKNINVWLFTRYELEEVPEFVLSLCEFIKCGRYIPELTTDDNEQYGIKLSTSNQKIYKSGVDY